MGNRVVSGGGGESAAGSARPDRVSPPGAVHLIHAAGRVGSYPTHQVGHTPLAGSRGPPRSNGCRQPCRHSGGSRNYRFTASCACSRRGPRTAGASSNTTRMRRGVICEGDATANTTRGSTAGATEGDVGIKGRRDAHEGCTKFEEREGRRQPRRSLSCQAELVWVSEVLGDVGGLSPGTIVRFTARCAATRFAVELDHRSGHVH